MTAAGEHVLAAGVPWRAAAARAEEAEEVRAALENGLRDCDLRAALLACRRLTRFLRLKGVLSLEQRAAIGEVLLEWLQAPGLSLADQVKILKSARRLLSKPRKALKLKVDWRALWALVESIHIRREGMANLASHPVRAAHAMELGHICRAVRHYVSPEAAAEVVAAAEPLFADPLSREMFVGQAMLCLFLPSSREVDYAPLVSSWLSLWDRIEGCAEWDSNWLCLVKRALKWGGTAKVVTPEVLAKLHNHVQASLRLASPAGWSAAARTSCPSYVTPFTPRTNTQHYGAKVAVQLLGCGQAADFYAAPRGFDALTSNSKEELAACLESDARLSAGVLYLRKLFSSTQTLFHPSNSSQHSSSVAFFAQVVCAAFVKRLGRERVPNAFGQSPTLSHADKAALVDALLPLLTMACYSKVRGVTHSANTCLTHLAWVAPIKVSNHFLPLIAQALDPTNLNQTHQAPAAIKMLTGLVQPLLQARPVLAEALPELLELTLPGLDPNDVTKTMTTCMLFQVVLSWVPIVDVDGLDFPSKITVRTHELSLSTSYGVDEESDEAQQDEGPLRDAMWRGAPVLVEWSLGCLDRILSFIDSQLKRAKGGLAGQIDNAVSGSLALTARLLFAEMSPSVLARAGERLASWTLDSVKLDALREAKTLLRSFTASVVAKCDGAMIKSILLENIFEPLLALGLSKDTSVHKLEWVMVLLGAVVRITGPHLLPYESEITRVIDAALEHDEARIRKLGAKLIRRSIRGLSESYIASRASSTLLKCSTPKDKLAELAVSWAQPCSWEDTCTSAEWHIPTEEELAAARRIADKYTSRAMDALSEKDRTSLTVQALRAELEILFQVTRGKACLYQDRKERSTVISELATMLRSLVSERESDTTSHRRVIKTIRVLLTCFGANTSSRNKLAGRAVWFRYMREMTNPLAYVAELRAACERDIIENRRDWVVPRYHQVDDIQTLLNWQLHEMAFDNARADKDAGEEGGLEDCFAAMCVANEHDWADTRKAALAGLQDLISFAPWFGKARVEDIIPRLVATDSDSYGAVLGAAKLLEWKKVIRWIVNDWGLLDKFMRTLIFEVGSIRNLADDKQKEASEALYGLLAKVLGSWTSLPVDKDWQKTKRTALLKDMTSSSGKAADLRWRQQMAVCVLLLIVTLPEDDSAVDGAVLGWVEQCVHSEMLPLRSAAISVLTQLLDRVPEKRRELVAKQLALHGNSKFFRTVVETLSQNHSNATTSVDGNTHGMKHKTEWSVGVGEMLRLARFPGDKFAIKTTLPSHSREFLSAHKLMMEKLIATLSDGSVAAGLKGQLDFLLFDNAHTAEHSSRVATGSEVVSAILSVGMDAKVLESASKSLFESSLEGAGVWLAAFRQCSNRDVQAQALELFSSRTAGLLKGSQDMSDAVKACNGLRVVRALVGELATVEHIEPSKVLVTACADAVGHPYDNVRRETGRTITEIADVVERRGMSKRADWVGQALEAMFSDARSGPRDRDASTSTRAMETVLHVLSSLVMNGGPARDRYVVDFCTIALEAQGHPNMEVSKMAKSAATCLASASFGTVEAAIGVVEAVSTAAEAADENWYTRMGASLVLGSLLIVNSCFLGYAIGAVHARKEIEKLLRDTQVEVHNAASATLTRVLSAYEVSSPSLETTKERYIKLARTKLAKSQYKTEEGKAKLKKRLTGVLGLTALVHAFPYTVPFPDAVVALAKRTSDPSPVGTSAKNAVQHFKHTHTDSWAEVRTHFTTEELEDLQDSNYSGSHA